MENPNRLMNTKEAASYCGMSHNTFDLFVKKELHVRPIRFRRRKLFDRKAIDKALDRIQSFPEAGDFDWEKLNEKRL